MSNGIGYSHALFSYGSNVRKFALEADKKENGGNDNGLLDGNEIAVFKQNIKKVAGFDFDFSEERFPEIEKEMHRIVKENLQLRHFTLDWEKAFVLMNEMQEPYKLELLSEMQENEKISFFQLL